MTDRPVLDVPSPPGGWGPPWPNVAEIVRVLPREHWTLVGGLMTQLHGVDVVAGGADVVDVLVADHPAPSVVSRLRGRDMVAIEGGTQALRRTVLATLRIHGARATTISVPSAFGALVLKAAAYRTDSRNPARHLQDAAVLLACLDDPYAAVEQYAGSDRARVLTLHRALPDEAPQWRALARDQAQQGQAALRILVDAVR